MKEVFFVLLFLFIGLNCREKKKTHKKFQIGSKSYDHPKVAKIFLPENIQSSSGDNWSFQKFSKYFESKSLSLGEIQSIFELSTNKETNEISGDDWIRFRLTFLEPFENLASDKEKLITEKEKTIPFIKAIFPNLKDGKDDEIKKMISFSVGRKEESFNFANYITLRRISFGWSKFASEGKITSINIPKAMSIITGKKFDENESTELIQLGNFFTYGDNHSGSLDFKSFLLIVNIRRAFQEISKPENQGTISQGQWMRAISNKLFSEDLNDDQLKLVFNYLAGDEKKAVFYRMSFPEFATISFCYSLFDVYAKDRSLAEEDFKKLLKDEYFPKQLKEELDKFKDVSSADISKIIEDKSKNPKSEFDFFTSFLEKEKRIKSSKIRFVHVKEDKDKASSNPSDEKSDFLHSIYYSFEKKGENKLNFIDFLRFFKLSWCFHNLSNFGHEFIDKLNNEAGCFNYLKFSQDEQINLSSKLADLVYNGNYINEKEFFSIFNYKEVFKSLSISTSNNHVTADSLKKGLEILGFANAKEFVSESSNNKDMLYNYENIFQEFLIILIQFN